LTQAVFNVLVLFVPTPKPTAEQDRAERRLAMLGALAEVGMALIDNIGEQAAAGPIGPEIGLLFVRVARAVRQTLALQARLESDPRLESGHRAATPAAVEAEPAEIVERAIEADRAEADPSEDEADSTFEARERLADPDDADFADGPLGEIVAGICADLGVAFEPGLWEDDGHVPASPQATEAERVHAERRAPAFAARSALSPAGPMGRGWPPDPPILRSG
jgi:hypothetical protein